MLTIYSIKVWKYYSGWKDGINIPSLKSFAKPGGCTSEKRKEERREKKMFNWIIVRVCWFTWYSKILSLYSINVAVDNF